MKKAAINDYTGEIVRERFGIAVDGMDLIPGTLDTVDGVCGCPRSREGASKAGCRG